MQSLYLEIQTSSSSRSFRGSKSYFILALNNITQFECAMVYSSTGECHGPFQLWQLQSKNETSAQVLGWTEVSHLFLQIPGIALSYRKLCVSFYEKLPKYLPGWLGIFTINECEFQWPQKPDSICCSFLCSCHCNRCVEINLVLSISTS